MNLKNKSLSGLLSSLFMVCIGLFATPKSFAQNNSKDSLAGELNHFLAQGKFNGFGVAIVNEKGVLYEQGFGVSDKSTGKKYTEHTIQNIASISKVLVGIALMKAVEMGKIKLDDPINTYLPFKVVNPYFPDEIITVRQLANHTSTIIDNEYYFTKNYFLKPGQDLTGVPLIFDDLQVFNPQDSVQSMPAFLKDLLIPGGKWYTTEGFLQQKPGEIYEYSNTGATLAAYIIELATGMSFDAFTEKYILKPLKMKASGWKFSDVNIRNYSKLYENPGSMLPFYGMTTYPDGNFITSAQDLGKLLTELIKGYQGKGTILSEKTYAEFFRQQLMASNFTDRNKNNPYNDSYNVGIFIGFSYTGNIGHTGGDPGVASMMFIDPVTHTGRLLILNTNISDQEGNNAFYGIWDAMGKYSPRLRN